MSFQHLVYPYCRCNDCRKGRMEDRKESKRLEAEDNAVIIGGPVYPMPPPFDYGFTNSTDVADVEDIDIGDIDIDESEHYSPMVPDAKLVKLQQLAYKDEQKRALTKKLEKVKADIASLDSLE